MRKLFVILAAVVLAGCEAVVPTPQTPAQYVYAAKASFAAAGTAAAAYARLPLCTPTSTPVCHDKQVLATTLKIAEASNIALDHAEQVVRDPAASQSQLDLAVSAARSALTAFVEITAKLEASK